jgi:histone H3/H4
MPRQTTLIPKAPIARLFRDKGVPRVSSSALSVVVEFLSRRSETIAKRAIDIAKHRDSRTINQGDVRLAIK